MPKLLVARPPLDAAEERTVRRLASSRHAPADWIGRARMIVHSWDGWRTSVIAAALRCHPQTVRERILRFNGEGIDRLGDRPGKGRKRRLSEADRSILIGLARLPPPRRPIGAGDGTLSPADPDKAAHWSLDALVDAAHGRGIQVQRSQAYERQPIQPQCTGSLWLGWRGKKIRSIRLLYPIAIWGLI